MTWLETRIPPPLVAALCGLAMWAAARSTPDLRVDFPLRAPLAGFLAGAGLALDLVSVARFWRAKTTISPLAPSRASQLVTGELYRFSRNPMYVGLAAILTGWAVFLGAPLALLGLAVFVAYITRFQIMPEERALRAQFGSEFEAYCARTRRWI